MSVYRISRSEDIGGSLGKAIRVSADCFLTCYHVVRGCDETGQALYVIYQKDGEKPSTATCRIRAKITSNDYHAGGLQDLALLELREPQKSLPGHVHALSSIEATSLAGQTFTAAGFSVGDDDKPLPRNLSERVVRFTLDELPQTGWYQVSYDGEPHIRKGFSGGPALIPNKPSCVGMVKGFLKEEDSRIAYVMPSGMLRAFLQENGVDCSAEESQSADPLEVYDDIAEIVREVYRETPLLEADVLKKIVKDQPTDICKIALEAGGVSKILETIRDWLSKRRKRKGSLSLADAESFAIKQFVGAIAVLSIDADWTKMQRDRLPRERIEVASFNAEARLPDRPINLNRLLVCALNNEPFDIERLFDSQEKEPEHPYDPNVASAGQSEDDFHYQLKEDMIRIIYKSEADLDRKLRDSKKVERLFDRVRQFIESEEDPVRLILSAASDRDSKVSRALKQGLGLSALFIICHVEKGKAVGCDLVKNFNFMGQIRDLLSQT